MNPFSASDWIKAIFKRANKPPKPWEKIVAWVVIILIVFLIIKGMIQ